MSPTDRPHHRESSLPVPLTTFVGRERAIAAVVALLRRPEVRLLTLTGPGGVGKTRVALQVASQLETEYVAGVTFVSLASIRDADLIISTVAQHLGIRESGPLPVSDQLETVLADRQLLLLLDNFEQVIEAGPNLNELLAACPNLKILVTSRIVLRLQGEQEYPLPPMPLLADTSSKSLSELNSNEAVMLFVQRARAARPDFRLTTTNAPVVAEICARLDGLPLAIELAAARIRLLQPHGLLARLTHRLPLLTGGPRDAPARQQTLHGTIAWSYELLASEEQRLFRHLAVFVGGFTLDAADTIFDADQPDILEGISTLLDSSLLVESADSEMSTRYLMLETIREYALDRLRDSGEDAATRERHANWCLSIAEKMWDDEHDSLSERSVEIVHGEQDNIRSAMNWRFEHGDYIRALELANRFSRFWLAQGQIHEARSTYDSLTQAVDALDSYDAAMSLLWSCIFEWLAGNYENLELVESRAVPLAIESGDIDGISWTLILAGVFAQIRGEFDKAETFLYQGVDQLREGGSAWQLPYAVTVVGRYHYHQGELDRAERIINEALAMMREHGYRWGLSDALTNLARIYRERQRYRESLPLYLEALLIRVAYGDRVNTASCLRGIGELLRQCGQSESAARFYGVSEAIRERIGVTIPAGGKDKYDAAVAALRNDLGEDMFSRAWKAGRQLSTDEAIAEAHQLEVLDIGLSDQAMTDKQPDDRHGLTAREREILNLLTQGYSSSEIADMLHISPRTERTHVNNIFRKLDVNSRAAAVAFAFQHGLAEGQPAPD